MLTEKYKPKTTKDVVSQFAVVEKLAGWFSGWKPGQKALFLYGPPGIGKTCIIEAFAAEKNLELIEMNASDYRTPEQIKRVAGSASSQSSLSGKKKLILIDEVDSLAREETVAPLVNLIKNSRFPIVMTANGAWDFKIRPLHSVAELVQMKKLLSSSVAKRLKDISNAEKLGLGDDRIKTIAEQSSGDIRSAINDLESFHEGENYRERKAVIFDVVRKILKSENAADARKSVELLEEDPEYLFWWIETNVVEEYADKDDLANAMKALALADLFRARIRKQNWKMLGYFIDAATAGVATAKKRRYERFVMYKPPEMISALSRTKKTRALRKGMCARIGKAIHESSSTVNSEYLPFLRIISKNNDVASAFGMTEEEAELLKS